MRNAAANLEFEEAARLRDEIKRLEALALGLAPPPPSPRRPKDRTPTPGGPGGGGYDPAMRKGRSRRK
jgi:excinuclease ABC subunit B